MPGSAISAGSGSHSSASSRRARTRQYRAVAPCSQVDESLFGSKHSATKRDEMLQERWATEPNTRLEKEAAQRSAKRGNRNNGKETVQVITKDLIRNLIVPQDDPSGQSIVMTRAEFERIQRMSRVLTKQEKDAVMERQKREKEEILDAVQERKNYMKMKDLQRRQNEKLNDLEEEEKMKGEHLRQKAIEQLQEQEDEIKHLNELILNAKCHAIRDAQILERDQIIKEMQEEERRLDNMMEIDRQNSIQVEEEIEKKRKQERLLGCYKVMEQIQENEQERLLELERKDQENRMMQKYLDKLCEEEAEKLEKRREEQKKLREDLNQCNAEILTRKELAKDQERLAEAKVLEYQKQKAEREMAFEKEQERIRIEKEKEVARLRALQERARDEQSERDALRAKRAQEQAQREWRQKEAEEARKKAETEAMLKMARSHQMEQKEHFLAVQAQRERADFERVLVAQQELAEKEKREIESKMGKRREYADDVRNQIREKEQQRVSERNAFFTEGVKLNEEARLRRQRLEEVKRKKLAELRGLGLPQKYVSEIQRKVRHTSTDNLPIDVA